MIWERRQRPRQLFLQTMGIILPETNSLHLNMDGWKTIVSFWDGLFSSVVLVLGSVDMKVKPVLQFPRKHVNLMAIGLKACVWRATA